MNLRLYLLLGLLLICACATTQENQQQQQTGAHIIPIDSSYPIKRIIVEVKRRGDFPSEVVENLVVQMLRSKGYVIVGRKELMQKVKEEQRIIRDQNADRPGRSPNIPGADALFLLEVTAWKSTKRERITYVEELVVAGKLIDTESKYIWVKNSGLGSIKNNDRTPGGLIGGVLMLPLDVAKILVGQGESKRGSDPVIAVVVDIMNSFPRCSAGQIKFTIITPVQIEDQTMYLFV